MKNEDVTVSVSGSPHEDALNYMKRLIAQRGRDKTPDIKFYLYKRMTSKSKVGKRKVVVKVYLGSVDAIRISHGIKPKKSCFSKSA